jgi:hypothetical protein
MAIFIKYIKTYQQQEVSEAAFDLVKALYSAEPPKRGIAIKFVHKEYNLCLRDAKAVCDAIGEIVCLT